MSNKNPAVFIDETAIEVDTSPEYNMDDPCSDDNVNQRYLALTVNDRMNHA